MMLPRIYRIRCHVCGRQFEIARTFLSGIGWQLADGSEVVMGSCNMAPELPHHTREEIRSSWQRVVGQLEPALLRCRSCTNGLAICATCGDASCETPTCRACLELEAEETGS